MFIPSDFSSVLPLAKLLLVPLAVLLLLAAERLWPWRAFAPGRAQGNWGLALLNTFLLWLLRAGSLVLVAKWAETRGLGLFNICPWPGWLEGLLAFLALDCAVYWQHRALHVFAPLWRLHRVHHTDTALDASTGLRFHPLEALLSALFKAVCVILLGASPLAAGIFAIALTVGALFSHSNLRLALRLQKLLRPWLVTPAMHRVHHSAAGQELNHNYGFFLPWWDHLFNTYQDTAAAGEALQLGQPACRAAKDQELPELLAQPFRKRAA